jgi:hypothetical protein
MRWLLRLSILAACTVSAGFVWTVGQSGLAETNRHLCELWASLPLLEYQNCQFQYLLVYLWAFVAILATLWVLFEFYRFAIWFLPAFIKWEWRKRSPWQSVSIIESNLNAYIRSSPLVSELDNQIAKNEQAKISPDRTLALPLQEMAKFLGICDIRLLDAL